MNLIPKASILVSALFLSFIVFAEPAHQGAGDDYFYLPTDAKNVSSVSEQDYLQMLNEFESLYAWNVLGERAKPLIIAHEWESPYFAAFAKNLDDAMGISLWGGMARAPGMSKAVMAAVLCHELGHILGGEPLQTFPSGEWASAEGQADFYAASVCLPAYLTKHPEIAPAANADIEAWKICDNDADCVRVAQTGFEMISFFQKWSYRDFIPVKLSLQEKPATELIRNSYPSDQCRLDTFIAGAICQLGRECRAAACWFPKQ